jgi:hypothetical protein
MTPAMAPSRRADDEGGGDHAVGVDAHQGGDVDVLGGGADGDAEARAIDEPREAGHHHHRQQDDGDLHAADGRAADGESWGCR